jgi:hypothetical protein
MRYIEASIRELCRKMILKYFGHGVGLISRFLDICFSSLDLF